MNNDLGNCCLPGTLSLYTPPPAVPFEGYIIVQTRDRPQLPDDLLQYQAKDIPLRRFFQRLY